MTFSLRAITGTRNHLIQRRNLSGMTEFVAEVVWFPEGFTLYRMDATGLLAAELPTPESALAHYERWLEETGTDIEGVLE